MVRKLLLCLLIAFSVPMNLSPANEEPDQSYLNAYVQDVERRTRRRFNPPRLIEKSLKAKVVFKIKRSGDVADIRFLKRSRDMAFDESIRECLNSIRYRHFPKDVSLFAEFIPSSVKVELNSDNQ